MVNEIPIIYSHQINFYNQYGAHDDRPLQLPKSQPKTKVKTKVEPEDKKRPGEIRFGGMSFALPPPGTYPDIPKSSVLSGENL